MRSAASSVRRRRASSQPTAPVPSAPKTTRPSARSRREPPETTRVAWAPKRRFDTLPDRIDIRDWPYRPGLAPLADALVSCPDVPLVLDQGTEGACTGFALAAVINFLLARRGIDRRVSPRMLYEMARCYDEWPGEKYEGSSARGAMKGWVAHGVCTADTWPMSLLTRAHLDAARADEARRTPGGAFYRVMHREIRDMHAALSEVGILYASLMVHQGWMAFDGATTTEVRWEDDKGRHRLRLPVIQRRGRADGGHAVALCGYTGDGFIVQNSWGLGWGARGFALLPYEDWLMHATDVWVAQLGVPVSLDLWNAWKPEDRAGLHRAASAIPLDEIRPYVVDLGNNGELSDGGKYWTTPDDLKRLFTEAIPQKAAAWRKRRIMLYLHGGLNDEAATARRVVAFRDVCLENEIYPLHVMWESGLTESLHGILRDLRTDADDRAGAVSDWMKRLRDGLLEARDRTLELTLAAPGGALWREMKENAMLASRHPDRKGGFQLMAREATASLGQVPAAERAQWEIHVVGHSAGSILAAFALEHLLALPIGLETVQFLAPAITVELFKQVVLPLIDADRCPVPTLYLLSDTGELDDDVGPYGKSLLYLVSNAFEGRRDTPLLGMERFVNRACKTGTEVVDPAMAKLFARTTDGRPSLVIAGAGARDDKPSPNRSRSESHGGFDNDEATLNSVLYRILGKPPKRPFTTRDLTF
jgi:hypothetical protein